ncbi:hypothetical protein [Marinicella gelatinilytica]|uniref:hypothetical protein n=1 Tax=Marinicella gelatinilytica TaxID=2996017 RepID=UPI002260EF5C|nr:hypothetical protein [Marinicella gelatinilytica]MCX7546181.1 hypothetical protein [Marinicella gelatinilytica]
MKKIIIVISFLMFWLVPTENSFANNMNEDVDLLIKNTLLGDDYAELFPHDKQKAHTEHTKNREISTTNGLNSKRIDNIVYFYISDSIRRYNLSTQSWDSEISLINPIINAFSVNDQSVFVAHGSDIYRYDLDGNPPVLLHTTIYEVTEMVAFDNWLLLNFKYENDVHMIDAQTGIIIDEYSYYTSLVGMTRQPGSNNIFARSSGVSPSDIRFIDIESDGTIASITDSPYHGNYPDADKVYSFSDGSRVVDSSGIVYFTNDMTYAGSFARSVDHLDFYEDLPIIMNGSMLYSYSNNVFETGQYQLSELKDTFYVYGDDVYLFHYNITSIDVETVAVSEFGELEPGAPVDPVGLVYNIDSFDYDDKDTLYLLSRINLTIFKFNTSTMSYEAGLPLLNPPNFMTYSKVHDVIYLGYSDGRITSMNPLTGDESPFVNIGQSPCYLKAVDAHLFVCDPAGAWVSHSVYHSTGALLDTEEWSYVSNKYTWSSHNRKLYHFRDGTSPNDIIWRSIGLNGALGDTLDSPYHGGVGAIYPICVPPTGLYVLLGSGEMYDPITLEIMNNSLSNAISACAWSKGDLFTLENTSDTKLQLWNESLVSSPVANWAGVPIDLVGLKSGALIIMIDEDGIPRLEIQRDILFVNGLE